MCVCVCVEGELSVVRCNSSLLFNIFLIVHLRIIVVVNQLDAQFLL